MSFKITTVLCGLFFMLASISAQAFEAKCIKTQVVKGEDCNHLVVHFDFAGCGLSAPTSRDVRSQCVNQKAVSFVRTDEAAYITTYGAPLDKGGSWVLLSVRSQPLARKKVAEPVEAPQVTDVETAPVVVETGGSAGGAVAVVVPTVAHEAMPDPNLPARALEAAPVPPMESKTAVELPKALDIAPTTAEIHATQEAARAKAEADAKLEEQAEAMEKLKHSLKISGLLDFYYAYNTNNPIPVTNPSATATNVNNTPAGNNTNRLFDQYHDTFTLNLAELTLKKQMEHGFAQVDLGFGNQASVSSPNDIATQNIMRAFITWDLVPDLDLRAGKLFSHMGVEEPYATENINYSRSLLFAYGVPLWNSGLAVDWKIKPESWSASFYLYNNNGNSAYDNNTAKSAGLRLEWHDVNTRVRYNMQAGAANMNMDQLRQYHELNLKWHVRDNWFVIADGMMGYQPGGVNYTSAAVGTPVQDAFWSGALVGVEWKYKKWSVAPRLEYYADPNGYTIAGLYGANQGAAVTSWLSQNLTSVTATVGYQIEEGAKLIAEFRQDNSDQNAYYNYAGAMPPVNATTPNSTSQTTASAAFLYEF